MRVPARRFPAPTCCAIALALFLGADPRAGSAAPALAFKRAADGGFEFDTGQLRGRLRPGGRALGLCSVVHEPTGAALDRSNGLFSHYRVFTADHRYGGGAWDWPGTARLRDDGAVEVEWPAAEGRPFVLRAVYRWHNPATLDLETSVTAHADLPGFESFLASYFSEPFTNCLVEARSGFAADSGARFIEATQSVGDWQMFTRDLSVLTLITDGRWKREPNPVNWVIVGQWAEPLGLRRAPALGLTAVAMAAPEDCFALATPQETDGHRSLYLSLFGRTVKAGETARARARLVVGTDLTERRAVELYQRYLTQPAQPR